MKLSTQEIIELFEDEDFFYEQFCNGIVLIGLGSYITSSAILNLLFSE